MADGGIGSIILFIAGLTIAGTIGGVLIQQSDQISNAISSSGDEVTNDINSDVTIISDTGSSAIYDGDNVTLLVQNTGQRTLSTQETFVLIDGQYREVSDVTVVDGDQWREGNVARVTLTDVAIDRDEEHRFTVGTPNTQTTIQTFID